jgi:hypothetical protein
MTASRVVTRHMSGSGAVSTEKDRADLPSSSGSCSTSSGAVTATSESYLGGFAGVNLGREAEEDWGKES